MIRAVGALAAGAAATTDFPPAPGDGAVASVQVIPDANITGVATNTRQWRVVNTSRASQQVATVDLVAGQNPAVGQAFTVPLVGNPWVREGDVLQFQQNVVGTGLADPGGRVAVTVNRHGGGQF